MKIKGIASILLACMLFGLMLGQIRSDYAGPGDELMFHVNVYNTGTHDAKDVSVKIYIPALDLFSVSNAFDVEDKQPASTYLFADLPRTASCGMYLAKVTASNNEYRDTRYAWVAVA